MAATATTCRPGFSTRPNSPSVWEFRNHGSENRRGSATCRPSVSVTTFDLGSKKSNATSPNKAAKKLDVLVVMLYATYRMTGKEIRALRRRLGWTQVALADAVGVSSNTVARWERGEMGISEPAARLLKRIASEQRVRAKER